MAAWNIEAARLMMTVKNSPRRIGITVGLVVQHRAIGECTSTSASWKGREIKPVGEISRGRLRHLDDMYPLTESGMHI